jgi:hypothetical protein
MRIGVLGGGASASDSSAQVEVRRTSVTSGYFMIPQREVPQLGWSKIFIWSRPYDLLHRKLKLCCMLLIRDRPKYLSVQ